MQYIYVHQSPYIYFLQEDIKKQLTKPFCSYAIKTAVLFILAYRTNNKLEFEEESDHKPLLRALEKVEGKKDVSRQMSKLKNKPDARWITDTDIDNESEEGRLLAVKVFSLIKFLAQEGYKLHNFWNRDIPIDKITGFGETEIICTVSDFMLQCLDKKVFYGTWG
jgi:hypothetical protein